MYNFKMINSDPVIYFYQLFDWVQFMKLSGCLLPLDVDTENNNKETPSNQYQLTKQETEDLVGCGAFSLATDREQDVKRTFSMEKQLHGKTSVLKSFTLDSGAVVSSVVNISCADQGKAQIGRIIHFLTMHDQLSGKETEFVTINLYTSCKQDLESLLYYVDTTLFEMKTVAFNCLSFPLVTAVDDENKSLLWILNI